MAGRTRPADAFGQGGGDFAAYFQGRVAGFALSGVFRGRQVAVGRVDYRRVHRDGARGANLCSISQGEDGYGDVGGGQRVDVQRIGAGIDGVDGGRTGRRGDRRGVGNDAGDGAN